MIPLEATSCQKRSDILFVTQLKATHRHTGASNGWVDYCRGHHSIDNALTCHETCLNKLKSMDMRICDAFTDQDVEIRIQKRTVILETVEGPARVDIETKKQERERNE